MRLDALTTIEEPTTYREAALDAWGAYLPMITKRANLLNDDWDKVQGLACVPHVPLDSEHYFERRALLDEIEYLEMYYQKFG
jgi:hypothetical protein